MPEIRPGIFWKHSGALTTDIKSQGLATEEAEKYQAGAMEKDCYMTIAILTLWALSLVALSSASVEPKHQAHATPHRAKLRGHAGCSTNGQVYRPVSYIPSAFEREWGEHAARNDEDACSFIRSNAPRVNTWLAALRDFTNLELSNGFMEAVDFLPEVAPRNEAAKAEMTEQLFSRMVYENICPGEFLGVRKEVVVEPLVGHLRHPYGLPGCVPDGEKEHSIVDLNYILTAPWAAADLNVMFPGSKYLFDLGSSNFGSSMQFLTTRYRQAGIDFESIWAWEVAVQEPKKYWEGVPDSYRQRLHFYNTPISDDFKEASHPLNIIRSVCEPGDFIVVKLDIDNGPLETAIMAEIAADAGLRHCISEMFFEQHYDHADMASSFGTSNGAKLGEVFKAFTKDRESGLLLHYWP